MQSFRPPTRTSAPGAGVQGRAQRSVLANGLRVVSIALPHLHSSLLSVFVRCGSRHETRSANGISHLLEHLLLRGSVGYPNPTSLAVAIESAGGELQGATGREYTVFQSIAHPSRLEAPFAVLGDLLARPLFNDLELEREVIREELHSEADEQGRPLDAAEVSMAGLFGDHPIGWPIGGTPKTLAALREDDLRAWHARAYNARNLIAVCGGPAPHEQVVRLAQQFLGGLPGGLPVEDGPPPRRAPDLPSVRFLDRPGGQTELRLSFRCVPPRDPSFIHLRILRRILADGPASRLQQELVERRALAYAVGASLTSYSDCAVFSVSAVCTPGKVRPVTTELLRIFGELRSAAVTQEELTRVLVGLRVRSDFMLDSPAAAVEWFGHGELQNTPAPGVEPWLRDLDLVTAADVRRAAVTLFHRGDLVSCVAGQRTPDSAALRRLLTDGTGLSG